MDANTEQPQMNADSFGAANILYRESTRILTANGRENRNVSALY